MFRILSILVFVVLPYIKMPYELIGFLKLLYIFSRQVFEKKFFALISFSLANLKSNLQLYHVMLVLFCGIFAVFVVKNAKKLQIINFRWNQLTFRFTISQALRNFKQE